jgi:calcium-dependent protein kinase
MTNVSLGKFSFDYAPFEDISDQAKDFVEKLLVKEPSKRLTAKNALMHEWLNCIKGNSEREITLSLTKTKLKRYVILRRFVQVFPVFMYLPKDFRYLISFYVADGGKPHFQLCF